MTPDHLTRFEEASGFRIAITGFYFVEVSDRSDWLKESVSCLYALKAYFLFFLLTIFSPVLAEKIFASYEVSSSAKLFKIFCWDSGVQ